MKYLNLVKYSLVSAAIVAAGSVGLSGLAGAQEGTANTMGVSPTRTDVSVDPGETTVVKIIATNPSDTEVSVRPVQNDFVAGDEDGAPAIILEETEFAPSHSLKRFMQPLEPITLGPRESKVVEVTIAVPADADAGGYFGAIRLTPTTPGTGGQVNLSPSVASLILLVVKGEVSEKMSLTDFQVQQNDKKSLFYTDGDGINAVFRFKNEGGVQMSPFGSISVTKGDKVVYQSAFNSDAPRDMVLPGSARRWEVALNDISGFGKYTAYATFSYGSANQTIEATQVFWVVPIPVIIGAIIGLVAAIALIVWLVKMYKNRDKKLSLGK